MYSAQNVHQRFTVYPSNYQHFVAVRQRTSDAKWEYNTNDAWQLFNPLATDLLLADLDFNSDSAQAFTEAGCGTVVQIGGIATGWGVEVRANQRYPPKTGANTGEFFVRGNDGGANTEIRTCSFARYFNGDHSTTDCGACGMDSNKKGTGYIMYTLRTAHERFAVHKSAYNHFVVVRRQSSGDGFQYDTNDKFVSFEPAPSDLLLATIDFANGQTVTPFTANSCNVAVQDENISIGGITKGFGIDARGEIRYTTGSNVGEYFVLGTALRSCRTGSNDAYRKAAANLWWSSSTICPAIGGSNGCSDADDNAGGGGGGNSEGVVRESQN